MSWTGKRVLVTGAGGFIGSHLCEALVGLGAEVTAMIRYTSKSDWGNLEFLSEAGKSALRVVKGNIEDGDFVSEQVHGKDVVFHLAALIGIPYSYEAPQSYVRSNIEGTVNVLGAVRKHSVSRMVHTSTSETYGSAQYVPIDEKHPYQAQSPYSASKISADMMAESYFRSFGVPVTTVRPFNTFGPRQSARAIIPTIVTQALASKEIRLGSLDPVRDLNYVSDTVSGFILAGESATSSGKTLNLGSGSGISIGELAKLILKLMGVDKRIVQGSERTRPEASEVLKLICDSTQAREILGWKPKVALEAGLQSTISFISDHPHLFKPGAYAV